MSRNPPSTTSAGSESVGSLQRSSAARGERSASNPALYMGDNDDTALPSMEFHSHHPQSSITHRRTGSTLKTVMRKIFNRKRQSQADELEENAYESTFAGTPMRKSVPTKGRSFLAVPPPLNLNSHRGSPLSAENLQIAETHLSPLSPLSSSTLRDSMPGNMPRRRRATLPSVVFSDDESRFAVASAISDPQEDRSHVPERRHSLLSHRLSRSTDALREMTDNLPETLVSWPQRTSSAPPRPASVPGSRSPPLDESSNSGQSGRPSSGTTVTSVTRMSAPSLTEADEHTEQPSLPSNVANLVNTMQQDDSVTLEQRLTTLEVKLIDLEFAIARLQTNSPENPTEKPSRPRHPPSSDSFPPHMRNKPSAFLSTSDRDDSPSPLPTISARPSSTSTIRADTMTPRTLRPAPSATSLSDYHGVSIEQYSTLVTLLRREQTARRNLETQVGGLRDDIRDLQRATLESMQPSHTTESRQFLRFRRALDDSDTSPVLRSDDKHTGVADSDSDWDRSDIYSRDDPFGPSKWERQRVVTAPMI
ncbi:unnamed protein product [Penicillium nalgiovense]|uniref:Uncharacterized protein n=1 Tax=Penicillium nalgiovense TaxID=60175 RepID=A0A9W4I054_PENNA|nr:unnamed protein product [Penicillium nalgiovense]CAG7945721.1 unnamed protein product [Penicillium nalgiovense]CAG7989742.1 unnamed protein product [Penicillium nalgiovense]CAG8034613.1 unnamed protein product [Penicillium nalgiovense]CAG8037267.1 unnamed protein product [Penicillium nalgiovense]